jgi:putative transposase
VPEGNAGMVAATIGTIVTQPDAEHVHPQLDVIAGMLAYVFSAAHPCRGGQRRPASFTGFPISR